MANVSTDSLQHPTFAVILPSYNRRKLLERALKSIESQTLSPAQIIVIDDGSTDGSKEYLESLGNKITTIFQENSGPGAARNKGVEAASADYLAFLDSDDLWFPWTLSCYSSCITESGCAILFGKPYQFSNENELSSERVGELNFISFDDYFKSGDEWRWWGVSSFVIKRSCLASARFIDDFINAEDADLMLQLGIAGKVSQITSPSTFAYRRHEGSIMNDTEKANRGVEHLIEQEKNGLYPGGKARKRERLEILSRHLRPSILANLVKGRRSEALNLYFRTFSWHLNLGRTKFLVGFWAKFVKSF